MSEQMKTIPLNDLITEEGMVIVNREWIARCAKNNPNPVTYLNEVVTGLVAMALSVKTSTVELSERDFAILSAAGPATEPEPSPTPDTPTQTAPASREETR
jgi:hypothetical protein